MLNRDIMVKFYLKFLTLINYRVHLLLNRYLIEAYHVEKQMIELRGALLGQKLSFGCAVIGKVFL